jgi:ADP-ribose pyrophosphatase YjhB (NUDIX family)
MAAQKVTMVARLILEKRGNLLFLAQTTKNGGKYSLVGGKVDNAELATDALVREAMEETGIIVQKEGLRLVHVLQRQKSDNTMMIVLYFSAKEWVGEAVNKEPKKFKGVHWCDMTNLPKNLSRITKKVLTNYQKGYMYTEYDERKAIVI